MSLTSDEVYDQINDINTTLARHEKVFIEQKNSLKTAFDKVKDEIVKVATKLNSAGEHTETLNNVLNTE